MWFYHGFNRSSCSWTLNVFIKPILVILTLPITVLTLGFLLVINALIILLCDNIVEGVDSFLHFF
jgi:putative membrane protein